MATITRPSGSVSFQTENRSEPKVPKPQLRNKKMILQLVRRYREPRKVPDLFWKCTVLVVLVALAMYEKEESSASVKNFIVRKSAEDRNCS